MAGNKSGETILGLLGTALDMGGKVLLGPDAGNIDLGAPFKLGANLARESREQKALLEVLQGNPHTAPLVEIGKGALANGGLLNGILPGEQGGMPQQTGMTDINSAMFPILLAKQGGNPELVNNLILAQAQKKAVDPLDRIKDLLGIQKDQMDIQNYLAPEDKLRLEAELSEKKTQERIAEQQSYPTPAQQETLTYLGDLERQANMLQGMATDPNFLKGAISQNLLGQRILQENDPDLITLAKMQQEYNNTLIQAKGGKSLTEYEGKRYNFVLPQVTDDIAFYKQQLAKQFSKQKDFSLRTKLQLVQAGKAPDRIGADPQQLQIYAAINKKIESDPKAASKDPKVIQAILNLGLEPEFVLPYYKKR